MKKTLWILVVLTMIFTLAACGESSQLQVKPAEEDAAQPEGSPIPAETSGEAAAEVPKAYIERMEQYRTALTEGWDGGKLLENNMSPAGRMLWNHPAGEHRICNSGF